MWLDGVPKRPSKADMKEFVRARLDGFFELRQAERARRRAEPPRKTPASVARQQLLPFPSEPAGEA